MDEERKTVETAQIMYLTPNDIQAVADVIYEAAVEAKTPRRSRRCRAKTCRLELSIAWRPMTPDIALFGRMITSDAFRDVESAAGGPRSIDAPNGARV